MNATFNITVSIEDDMVTTTFGSEKIEKMNTSLLTSVLKEISNVENRIKTQVMKYSFMTLGQNKQMNDEAYSTDDVQNETAKDAEEQDNV